MTDTNVEDALQQARLTKTAREIAHLRRAVQIGDVGQGALTELVKQAGRTEFEMWAELTSRMYRAVGREIPVTGELITGPRTCIVNYPAGPRERTTQLGDAALMDISQRVDGCGTFGARSEKNILVTESGPEILSQFEWGI